MSVASTIVKCTVGSSHSIGVLCEYYLQCDSKTCHSCLVLRGVHSYCCFCAHTIQCSMTTCSNSNQIVIRCTSGVTLPCTYAPQNNLSSTHRHMVCTLHRVCTGAIIPCTTCTGMHVQDVHMYTLHKLVYITTSAVLPEVM